MAIIIDEFATTEGLVTLEDLTEEVVGETLEADEDVPIEVIDERTALVRGEVNIHEVNETLEINLPEEGEFETIAGFIFNRAGRLVEEGEEFVYRTEEGDDRIDEADALVEEDQDSHHIGEGVLETEQNHSEDLVWIIVEEVADARIIKTRISRDLELDKPSNP